MMIGLRHPSSSFNFRSVVGPFRCHHEAAVAGGFPTHYTLHNGAKIPSVALGVWQAGKGEFGPAVKNEREVGVELKESEVPRDRVWLTSKVLERLVEKGKVKNIGVSKIQNLTAKPLKIQPAVKQVEINYWFLRPELLEWSKKSGILLEAYSPLGSSKRASDTQHSCGLHMKPMALALTMSVR
ncbi:aldo-keto reductase [Moniliophthora roreri]|nr:aldo-keto reductase [Moniliophthora roreri]